MRNIKTSIFLPLGAQLMKSIPDLFIFRSFVQNLFTPIVIVMYILVYRLPSQWSLTIDNNGLCIYLY